MSAEQENGKFFKRNAFAQTLVGWVNGVRYNMPSVSIEKAILQFYDHYKVNEKEFMEPESARSLFFRAKEDFDNLLKNTAT